MKFSIITIGYNNRDGMRATLESVATQRIPNNLELEHVIVDGGSMDGTVDVIKDYVDSVSDSVSESDRQRREVKWVSEKDRGIYNAMNKGINMATGDYCLFLNSGDILARPDVLARVLSSINAKRSTLNAKYVACDIYYGDVVKVKGRKKRRLVYKDNLTFADFVSPYPAIHHQAAFIKRSLFDSIDLYREDMYIAADWYFFFQAVIVSQVLTKHIPIVVSICDMSGLSNTMSVNDPKKLHDQSIRTEAIQQYLSQHPDSNVLVQNNQLEKLFTKIKWRISILLPLKLFIR